MSVFPQLYFKFLRQGAGEDDFLTCAGMTEAQTYRVETLARETRHCLFPAVDSVA